MAISPVDSQGSCHQFPVFYSIEVQEKRVRDKSESYTLFEILGHLSSTLPRKHSRYSQFFLRQVMLTPRSWTVFRNLFGTEEARTIFSDHAYIQRLIEVESALARAESKELVIPSDAGEAIAAQARIEKIESAVTTEWNAKWWMTC